MGSEACLRMLKLILIAGVLVAYACAASAADDVPPTANASPSPYELGQGLRLGDSGFTLGGYSSLQVQNLEDADTQLSLSHLSMFVWWDDGSRLKFFSELDSQDLLAADTQSEDDDHRYLAIERLYFDYAYNDSITLRVGKFLTPIGRWNQIHADPLVWTTSRPLITANFFPDHASGAMALGNIDLFGLDADYMLYTSIGTDVRPDPAENPFNEAVGGRLNIPVNQDLQLGLSLASFDLKSTQEIHERLIGTDFIWSSHGYEVSAEAAYRFSSLGSGYDGKGGFLQAVAPLWDKLFAVGRIETINDPNFSQSTRLYVVGLNYRESRALSVKLEFIHGFNQNITAPGFLSSVSVLF